MTVPRRRNENQTSVESITNINQLFNDDDEDEQENNRDHNGLEETHEATTPKKGNRSSLRNVS